MLKINAKRKIFSGVLIAIMIQSLFITSVSAFWESDYTLVESGDRSPIPKAYEVIGVIQDVGNGMGFLDSPEHMFIDSNDYIYIADTGNNRILKLDIYGEGIAEIYGPEDDPLNEPKGVYVTEDGAIFVADTGNSRVVHFTQNGRFVEEFTEPDSPLLDTSVYPFSPSKIVLDPSGNLNILSGNDFRGIISIDPWNEFRGYIGTNRVPPSLRAAIVRLFATPEQREQLTREVPPYFSNITVDADGIFYTTTVMAPIEQIKKINILGVNLYPSGTAFGETYLPEDPLSVNQPRFIDLTVSSNRVITAIDLSTRRIYQYDQEGNALCVFGGRGPGRGRFEYPVSVETDSRGFIYVLDRDRSNIQIFERTPFMELVHSAVDLYYEGRYEEALVPWEQVLEIDSTYALAHFHVGKALYKEENYQESMRSYFLADNRSGYSDAFEGHRNEIYRNYFVFIIAGAAILVFAIFRGLRYLKKLSDKYILEELIG